MTDNDTPQVTGVFSPTATPTTAATTASNSLDGKSVLVYRTSPTALNDVRILGYLILSLLLVILWFMVRLLTRKDHYKPGPVHSHDPTYVERDTPGPRRYTGTALPESVVAQWDTFSALQSYNAPPAGDPAMMKDQPTENNLWAQMFAGEAKA